MNAPFYFKRILLLASLLSTLFLYAQKPKEVTIEGTAPFGAQFEIRAITFSDYINFIPQVAATAKISKTGYFKLTFKISEIQIVQLEINTSRSELFIVPGYQYKININMDEQLFKMFNPADENGFLQITNIPIDTNDLNYKINQFNNYYQTVLEKYADNITRYRSVPHYDTLISEINTRYSVEYNPTNYFTSYIFYTLGQIEAIVKNKDAKGLYNRYFDNDYILYDNPAYMTLFNYYYDNYLYLSPRISKDILDKAINEKCDYLELFNAVGKDFSLANERLRELVIIKNLTQFIGNDEFNQENLLKLLTNIIQNTHFYEHKKIAEFSLETSLKFHTGSSIPKFSFKTANGSNFDPSDYKGKWIYYQFFSTQCVDCIREMTIINELQKQHQKKIVFVSVSVDADVTKFIQFRKKYSQFGWEFVHFNQSYEWLKYYEINSLPEYLLITPEGKLYNRYPDSPDRDLAVFLLRLFDEDDPLFHPLDPRNNQK